MHDLAKIKQIVGQCDRCANCITVCPLYKVEPKEKSVSRGKIAFTRAFLEGGLEPDEELKKALDYCLLCRACTEVCPSKILTDEAMMEMRAYLNEKVRVGTLNQLVGFVMGSKTMVNLGSVGVRLVRHLPYVKRMKSLPIQYSMKAYQAGIPRPAIIQEKPATPPREVKKIGYFKGCAMKMFFPEASEATVHLLKKQGEVEIPNASCCGAPHLSHGLTEKFVKLAQENITLFKEYDVVVTDCASCGSVLKDYGERLKSTEFKSDALAFSSKVMGLSEFLTTTNFTPSVKRDLVATYHDPCHLNRVQGIKQQPRNLLKQATQFVEMPNADRCCGGAGTFQIEFEDASRKILDLKTESVQSVQAQILVTECPSCMMQLSKAKGNFQVMHISQVLEGDE